MPVVFRKKDVIDGLRPRIDKDVYQTPDSLADAIVNCYVEEVQKPYGKLYILDPGAGGGAFGKALHKTSLNYEMYGIDIRNVPKPETYDYWFREQDFLSFSTLDISYDLIIGNPPFNQAEKFIYKAKSLLAYDGVIMFLLPTDFQHTVGRGRGLFKNYCPVGIFSLMQRPNFTGPNGESLGKANTDNYILGIWKPWSAKDYAPYHCVHGWLDWKK